MHTNQDNMQLINTWWAISIHYMIKGVYKNVDTDLDKKLLKTESDCNCGLHQSY